MNILYPKIPLVLLLRMLRYATLGSLLAGTYGVIHDQITFSISPEYFTRFKFQQFSYADFGYPPRVFVSQIGFLATWWVGFFAGWFIARIAVPVLRGTEESRCCLSGLLIVFAFAVVGSSGGYILGALHGPDYSSWSEFISRAGVVDTPAFVRVAYIHNASYLGGLIGLVVAILKVRRLTKRRCCAERSLA